jgi:uncharacterized membrane protein
LSQIDLSALDPRINHPFIAITCFDWSGAVGVFLMNRLARCELLSDDDGAFRLLMPTFGFVELCERLFGKLKEYVVNDASTSLHMSKVFLNILACSAKSCHENEIVEYAKHYLARFQAACTSKIDRARLADC